MKSIDICGKTFEVIKPRKPISDNTGRTRCRSLEDYYDRPSQEKIRIYNEWRDWVVDVETSEFGYLVNFGISSANTFQFSITFRLEWMDNSYIGFITRDHNRLYLLQ